MMRETTPEPNRGCCGDPMTIPYETKPCTGQRGQHTCTPKCIQPGTLCLTCRLFKPTALGA